MLVKTLRAAASSLILALVGVGAAAAQDDRDAELDRWVPSVGFIVGVGSQQAEGHITTSQVVGPQNSNPALVGQPVIAGTPQTTRTRMMTPFIGGSFEIMTPSWTGLRTDPRLFANVDVTFAFPPQYNIPNIGSLGPLRPPPGRATGLNESNLLGQGARLRAEVQPLFLMAGAGIAFTFRPGERALRIKPSVQYVREEINVSGLAQRAVQPNLVGPTLNQFRRILLSVEQTVVYHGVGPGLDVELDTRRAGPFVLTVFAGAKAWNFLNNDKLIQQDQNIYGEFANWQFLKTKWGFGGAIGLRFRWVPE